MLKTTELSNLGLKVFEVDNNKIVDSKSRLKLILSLRTSLDYN